MAFLRRWYGKTGLPGLSRRWASDQPDPPEKDRRPFARGHEVDSCSTLEIVPATSRRDGHATWLARPSHGGANLDGGGWPNVRPPSCSRTFDPTTVTHEINYCSSSSSVIEEQMYSVADSQVSGKRKSHDGVFQPMIPEFIGIADANEFADGIRFDNALATIRVQLAKAFCFIRVPSELGRRERGAWPLV